MKTCINESNYIQGVISLEEYEANKKQYEEALKENEDD